MDSREGIGDDNFEPVLQHGAIVSPLQGVVYLTHAFQGQRFPGRFDQVGLNRLHNLKVCD